MSDYLINKLGEPIAGPYDLIENFREGLAVVKNNNEGCGYIDQTGKQIIQLKYDVACRFSENLAAVKLNDKWTYINKHGECVLHSYELARSFQNGLAAVQKNGNWHFIDREGRTVNQIGFTHCLDYNHGLAVIKLNGKFGAIDTDGNLVIKNKYTLLDDFSEGFARVKIKNRFGFISLDDVFIVDPIYSSAESFSENRAAVKFKNSWGFINSRNEIVVPFSFDFTSIGYKEGFCFVGKNNKIGVIDMNGNTKVPFVFKSGLAGNCEYSFKNGYAYVSLDQQFGKVSGEGYLVEKKSSDFFNSTFGFEDYAKWLKTVSDKTNYFGFIDTNGKVIVPFIYNHAWSFNDGLAPVFTNEGAGYVNTTGDITIPLIYRDATPFKDGYAVVTK